MLFSSRGLQQARRFYGLLEDELYGRVRSSNQKADRKLVLGGFLRAGRVFCTGRVDAEYPNSHGSAQAPGNTYFKVWQSDRVRWSVAQADYSHRIGDDIELCEVIALVDQNSNVIVLRKLPFTKTDVDVPKTTEWSLLDLADTRSQP
jgi:hypothetical protein